MFKQDTNNLLLLAAIYQNSVEDVHEAIRLGANVNKPMKCYWKGSFVYQHPIELVVEIFLDESTTFLDPTNMDDGEKTLQIIKNLIQSGANLNIKGVDDDHYLLESMTYMYDGSRLKLENDVYFQSKIREQHKRFENFYKLFLKNGANPLNTGSNASLLEILCWDMKNKAKDHVINRIYRNIVCMLLAYGCHPPDPTYIRYYRDTEWQVYFENWQIFMLFYCLDRKTGPCMFYFYGK